VLLSTSFCEAPKNKFRCLIKTHLLFHIQSKAAQLVTKIVSNNRKVIYLLISIPNYFSVLAIAFFFCWIKSLVLLSTSFCEAPKNKFRCLIKTHLLFHIQSKAAQLVTNIVSNNRTVIYLLSSIPNYFSVLAIAFFFVE
jgi:hypothetical protein